MYKRFKREKLLLSQRVTRKKLIGYARTMDGEMDYLGQQILSLKEFGCTKVFSEVVSLSQDNKPMLQKAMESLSEGDALVLTKLDRAFQSKFQYLKITNEFLNKGIELLTLSGQGCFNNKEILYSIFNVLYELENLEYDCIKEKKAEILRSKGGVIKNLGGRPKISSLKASLVIRLRNEGCSYRSIRSQTGIALSTIRRIILDSEGS